MSEWSDGYVLSCMATVQASPVMYMSEWSEEYEQTAAEVKEQLQDTFGARSTIPGQERPLHWIVFCAGHVWENTSGFCNRHKGLAA